MTIVFFFYVLLDIVDKRKDVVRPDIKNGLSFWSLVELLSVFSRVTGFKFNVFYLQPNFALLSAWLGIRRALKITPKISEVLYE